jgi:hypothetical protein
MAENKTKVTHASVAAYIDAIDDDTRRKDCEALVKVMAKVTKERPRMWGTSIVGFGSYRYKYESGREGDDSKAHRCGLENVGGARRRLGRRSEASSWPAPGRFLTRP